MSALPASAQSTGRSGASVENPLEVLRARMAENMVMTSLLPMEGAVDPETYRVGPGDFFTVVVGSVQGSAAPIPVSADGRLPLPEAGSVEVAGLTLAAARDMAIEALRNVFGRVPVDVTLSMPRQFYVHVTGAVPVPGRVLSLPVGRVSTAIEFAFSDTTRAPVTNPRQRPALRNVSVVHRDGSQDLLDLMRYFSAGDKDENPYLSDGDVIYVPSYDPAFEAVQVNGAVPFPGRYDARPDDNLRAVLRAAGLIRIPAHVPNVRVQRTAADGTSQTFTIDAADALGPEGAAFRLYPRDNISVAPEQAPGGTASIEGWVFHPGSYTIEQGQTSLQDLLERAGGVRPDARLRGAVLERRALPDPQMDFVPEERLMPNPDIARLMAADTLAILQQMRLTDLDFLSRAYFAQELRTQNRVSVDLNALLTGDAGPVMLRDGDRLIVPRDDNTVYVSGQVLRPGFVLHVEGRPVSYYVEAAGGRGAFASDVYLIREGTSEVIEDRNAIARSGDVIFVDRREDLAMDAEMQRLIIQESTARSDARIRIAGVAAQAIGSLATLVAVIVSLRRQ